MGGGGGGSAGETDSERALAEVASEKLRDYRQRWAPMIQRSAEIVQGLKDPNAFERQAARGRAATETTAQFDRAQDQVETSLENRGVGAGSSAFRLASVNLGADRARSRGLNVAGADQAVDQAYVEGLTNLMKIGQGKEETASIGLERQADLAARQASADAAAAASERAGRAEVLGTAAGVGIGYNRFPQRPQSTQAGLNLSGYGPALG